MPGLENSFPKQPENIQQSEASEPQVSPGLSFFKKLKSEWSKRILIGLGGLILLTAIIYAANFHGKRGQEPQITPAVSDESEKAEIKQLIASFEKVLNLAGGEPATQEKFFSFFTQPKTPGEQEEKDQLFCKGAFPCLWVSTSSLAGVSRYELLGLEKIADGRYKADVKEWVIRYSAPEGKYIETSQRTNPLIIVKKGDKWLIESYGTNTKYMGIYAG